MALKTYRELDAWKFSTELVVEIYKLTSTWPTKHRFGLASQIERASVSIPANIAEGYGRLHRGDYVHHLSIANGSLAEVETHLHIAVKLDLIDRETGLELWSKLQSIGKLLRGLIRSLKK